MKQIQDSIEFFKRQFATSKTLLKNFYQKIYSKCPKLPTNLAWLRNHQTDLLVAGIAILVISIAIANNLPKETPPTPPKDVTAPTTQTPTPPQAQVQPQPQAQTPPKTPDVQPEVKSEPKPEDPLELLKSLVENPPKFKPSPDELDDATYLLSFANQAQEAINSGWLAQADLLAFFIRVYLGEWELAILPKVKEQKDAAKKKLWPPEDLFAAEIRPYLIKNLEQMFTSLDAMLKTYQELAKYVLDDTVQDEGVAGKRLTTRILKQYETFKEARSNYFGVIDEESKSAEDLLLTDEPLRRQIMAARYIFGLFQDVSWALTQEKSRAVTRDLAKKLTLAIDYAAEPPFRGKPLVERSYRYFLKMVLSYNEVLKLGNEEGFYPETRKKLNECLTNSRQAYNDFAKMLNQ